MMNRQKARRKSLHTLQSPKKSSEWSAQEKKQLLAAMRQHGVSNLPALAVPSRTPAEVCSFLEKRKREGVWRIRSKAPPLESWLEAVKAKDDFGHLCPGAASCEIATVLQLIAEAEEHPAPQLCGGVNYREAYTFLSQVLQGIQTTQVSQATAQLLHQSCLWLATLAQHKDVSEHINFLGRISRTPREDAPSVSRTYSRASSATESMPAVFQEASMNPLGVPLELLRLSDSDVAGWNNTRRDSGV